MLQKLKTLLVSLLIVIFVYSQPSSTPCDLDSIQVTIVRQVISELKYQDVKIKSDSILIEILLSQKADLRHDITACLRANDSLEYENNAITSNYNKVLRSDRKHLRKLKMQKIVLASGVIVEAVGIVWLTMKVVKPP